MMKIKYLKLFTGELITIDEVAYMVIMGIDRKHYDALSKSGKMKYNKFVYPVILRSVKYMPEKFKEYIRCRNTELPPFERINF